ncbi:unnamed protein product [Lathyrus sativus]|nr:unnamed protein product [Lathyrus sativus]
MDYEDHPKTEDILVDIQQIWDRMLTSNKFKMNDVYMVICSSALKIMWKNILRRNAARPRALITMWFACHGRLATKQRLFRFGIITDDRCCLCSKDEESINHLFFCCPETVCIWTEILDSAWDEEMEWLCRSTKGKGYDVWKYRNDICYGNVIDKTKIGDNIIDMIVYRE